VKNMMVVLAPGAIGAMVEFDGKQLSGEQLAGKFGYTVVTFAQSTTKPWGLVPLFFNVSVTVASFCVLSTVFENPLSSTVRLIV